MSIWKCEECGHVHGRDLLPSGEELRERVALHSPDNVKEAYRLIEKTGLTGALIRCLWWSLKDQRRSK